MNVSASGLDTLFNSGDGASINIVRTSAIQSDGKVIIGGEFTSYNGITRNRIARLNTDGSLDTSFTPKNGFNVFVSTIVAQSDGKIVVGGYFTAYDSVVVKSVARLYFEPYTLRYTAGAGGTISGTTEQSVSEMADGTLVTAVPNTGYSFYQWSDGSVQNPRTDIDVTGDHVVTATFLQDVVIQYSSNSGGGIIGGESSQSIPSGSSGTQVVAIPDPGYRFLYWDDNLSTDPIRQEINVTEDTYISASFEALVCGVINTGNYSVSATLVGVKLYVMNSGTNTVSVIDTTTNTVIDTLTVGFAPNAAILSGTKLFVLNSGDDTVSVINTANDTVSDPITVGDNPITATLVGTKLYINNYNSSVVSVINTNDNTVADPITVEANPSYSIVVNTKLYVLNSGANTISVINTENNSVIGTIPVTSLNYAVAIGSTLYVLNPIDQDFNLGSVTVIDTETKTIIPCATTFTCAYLSGTNGSITGSKFQTITEGTNSTAVTAVPESGYVFTKWSDNSIQNPRTDTNVTGNVIVTAQFDVAPDTFTLTYTAGSGGTITGNISQAVNDGADGTAVTAVPNSGYVFTKWSDNSTQNPRTDTNVTENISVTAIFTAVSPSPTPRPHSRVVGGNISSGARPEKVVTSTPVTSSTTCPANQILTQNLKAPSRNGVYNTYTKGIVKEAHILQAHLNRLGFNSGKEDGILGPISTGAIKRMQTYLGTKADGYVGPITRGLLNNSCGSEGLKKS